MKAVHKPAVAGDVMSTPLITVERDTTLEEAANVLSEHEIGGALVVDHDGKPLGVVSLYDVVTYLAGRRRDDAEPGGFYRYSFPRFGEGGEGWERGWEEVERNALRELPVAEIMTTQIISVPDETPIEEVAAMLWRRHIHRVFVTSAGRPTGVITTMDVLRALTGGPKRAARKRASLR
jgi:CBS domain-containing protein